MQRKRIDLNLARCLRGELPDRDPSFGSGERLLAAACKLTINLGEFGSPPDTKTVHVSSSAVAQPTVQLRLVFGMPQ